LRLHDKRGKEKFKAAVAKCLDREILTTERVRKFSWRARQYICAYYKIAKEREGQQIATEATHLDPSPIQVEKMVKLFKTHHCALDFDSARQSSSSRRIRRLARLNNIIIIIFH
jgi:hypothetical protein